VYATLQEAHEALELAVSSAAIEWQKALTGLAGSRVARDLPTLEQFVAVHIGRVTESTNALANLARHAAAGTIDDTVLSSLMLWT
jgi:hypothetical protein